MILKSLILNHLFLNHLFLNHLPLNHLFSNHVFLDHLFFVKMYCLNKRNRIVHSDIGRGSVQRSVLINVITFLKPQWKMSQNLTLDIRGAKKLQQQKNVQSFPGNPVVARLVI